MREKLKENEWEKKRKKWRRSGVTAGYGSSTTTLSMMVWGGVGERKEEDEDMSFLPLLCLSLDSLIKSKNVGRNKMEEESRITKRWKKEEEEKRRGRRSKEGRRAKGRASQLWGRANLKVKREIG